MIIIRIGLNINNDNDNNWGKIPMTEPQDIFTYYLYLMVIVSVCHYYNNDINNSTEINKNFQ